VQYSQTGTNETGTVSAKSYSVLDIPPSPAVQFSSASVPSNIVVSDDYIHDVREPAFSNGCDTCALQRDYISRNLSTPAQHSAGISGVPFNNSVIAFNVYEDLMGTSLVESTSALTWQNIAIYNNLSFCTQAADANWNVSLSESALSPQCGVSSFFSDDDGSNVITGSVVYGNTLVARANSVSCKIWYGNVSSTVTVENNLLYCPNTSSVKIIASTHDYNTGFMFANNNVGTPSAHEYWYCGPTSDGGLCTNPLSFLDPFVNSADSTENFQLSSETIDPHLNDGVTLATPYNVDLAGSARLGPGGVWVRGALNWLPNSATSLSVTGVQ